MYICLAGAGYLCVADGVQDEDITFTAPPFCLPVPLPRPESPHPPHPPEYKGDNCQNSQQAVAVF